MKPFLVSGCSEYDLGHLAELLPEGERVFARRRGRHASDVPFSPADHAGLIILGDGEAWATSKRYRLDRLRLAAAMAAGRPVLGVCFGAQLLYALLADLDNGRSLSKSPGREHVGRLVSVRLTAEGATDPVVGHLADGTAVPHWHEDSFGCHPEITPLAWSVGLANDHCEAFRVGEPEAAVYGLQFHPEPTIEMVRKDGAEERWFEVMPQVEELERAAAAGKRALQAWLRLARFR